MTRRTLVEANGVTRAMIVDDSRAMRSRLRKMLSELGCDTCEAGNGQEALALLEKEGASLSFMLVDWNMPVMCGIDLVKAMRSDQRYSSITLIMVTTETEIERISQALEAGANEYVMKPFTKEMIGEKLQLLNLVR
jgi:two-component system chemotaxis response regulator CheY